MRVKNERRRSHEPSDDRNARFSAGPLSQRALWVEVLAVHDRPQEDRLAIPCRDYLFLLCRRLGSDADAFEPHRTAGVSCRAVYVQQALHSPRSRHDFFLPGTFHTGGAGEFFDSFDDWRERRRLPEAEPTQLVHLYGRWDGFPLFRPRWWCRHRMDVLHAAQLDLCKLERNVRGDGGFHLRIFLDPDGPELHRDDPYDASSRADLVSSAAFPVVSVCDQHHLYSRHAGHCDHDGPADA